MTLGEVFFEIKIPPVLFSVCIRENRGRNTTLMTKKKQLGLLCHKAMRVCAMSDHVHV